MIVGPNWNGDALVGGEASARADQLGVADRPDPGRSTPEELDRLRILQARVLLETPDMRNERRILETRELMRQRTIAPPEPVADWPAPNRGDPFDLFEVGARALGESPLSERDRTVFETFAPLRLRPGRKFDLRAFSEAERERCRPASSRAMPRSAPRRAGRGRTIDGWTYGERHLGNFGDDYLYRAATALTGLGAPEPAEAVSVTCNTDAADRPLSGANRYELTFPADRLPPACDFWSLSMYELTPDGRAFFSDNPIDRYAIGDHTQGLQKSRRWLAHALICSTTGRQMRAYANWLPAPAGRDAPGPARL